MKLEAKQTSREVRYIVKTNSTQEKSAVGVEGKPITLISNTWRYKFRNSMSPIHPDLLALAAFITIQPYVKDEIEFTPLVSKEFAHAIEQGFAIRCKSIDPQLQPRRRGKRPALAFSGGADSVACSVLMPNDTIKFTYDRIDHVDIEPRVDNYSKTVLDTVRLYDGVVEVSSDAEYVNGPFLQYSTWGGMLAAGVLISDQMNIGDIAIGLPLQSPFLQYDEGKQRYFDGDWRPLYLAAGIDIVLPICGVTEYTTTKIVNAVGLGANTSSCTYGTYGRRCLECVKCFRKDLISAEQGLIPWSQIRRAMPKYLASGKVQNYILLRPPLTMDHQDIYMYIMKRHLLFAPKPMRLFRKKILLNPKCRDIGWVTRYDRYELLRNNPGKLGKYIDAKIRAFTTAMDKRDYDSLRKYDRLAEYYSRDDIRQKVKTIDEDIIKWLVERGIRA